LLLSLKQAIPAAGKSEVCNTERQKWVVSVSTLTSDPAPEFDKPVGRLICLHMVGSCSYQVVSSVSVAFEFAEETDSLSFLEIV